MKLSALGFSRAPLLPPTDVARKSSEKRYVWGSALIWIAAALVPARRWVSITGRRKSTRAYERPACELKRPLPEEAVAFFPGDMMVFVGYIHPELRMKILIP